MDESGSSETPPSSNIPPRRAERGWRAVALGAFTTIVAGIASVTGGAVKHQVDNQANAHATEMAGYVQTAQEAGTAVSERGSGISARATNRAEAMATVKASVDALLTPANEMLATTRAKVTEQAQAKETQNAGLDRVQNKLLEANKKAQELSRTATAIAEEE